MNKVIYRIIGLLMLVGMFNQLQAQTQRTIRIAQDKSYTDHVSLKKDSKDMDLMVKFIFDEPNNTLTVSLVSYRNLFVFHDDVRYKQVVKCKKLRPERFPYVVETDAEMKYKLVKELRKQIPRSKKKHIFKRWLSYEGLQPQPMDYKMVNDYIEQKFDILDKDTLVMISLHDLMVMEPIVGKKKRYDFVHYTDLDREYQVHIERNPCLGKEEEIETAKVMVENIRTSYETLKGQYIAQDNPNIETLELLDEMRSMLLEQFPFKEVNSSCPSIRLQLETYNNYVDSIRGLDSFKFDYENRRKTLAVGAEQILGVARIVDNNVASWVVSTDVVEKNDLVKRSQLLIDEINQYLSKDVIMDEEQASAVYMFKKAEKYFKATCIQTKKKK